MLKTEDSPVTRPGFHLTPEGHVVGAGIEDFDVEWEGPEDERTAGVTEVAGVPVVTSKGAEPPQHPNARSSTLPPNGVDGTPGAPGDGGVDPGAAAPAVTTSVDGAGNKRTVEHEIDVEGTLTEGARRALEEAAKEAERQAKQLKRR